MSISDSKTLNGPLLFTATLNLSIVIVIIIIVYSDHGIYYIKIASGDWLIWSSRVECVCVCVCICIYCNNIDITSRYNIIMMLYAHTEYNEICSEFIYIYLHIYLRSSSASCTWNYCQTSRANVREQRGVYNINYYYYFAAAINRILKRNSYRRTKFCSLYCGVLSAASYYNITGD